MLILYAIIRYAHYSSSSMKRKIKIGIICLAAIIIAILGLFRQWSLPATQTFCKSDFAYVNLSECSCSKGTMRTIETPEGGEEAVLICRTISSCKGEAFYEQQAISLTYQVWKSGVSVSGCLADRPGGGCQEKTLNLSSGQEFYLASGKEQSVKISLEKIKDNKAYLLFSYGAAPPACETVGGCDYNCEFIKE